MTWRLEFTKAAIRDSARLKSANLDKKAKLMVEELKIDPYAPTFHFERLMWDLQGCFSKRINIKHRLVYTVNETEGVVRILRMWNHYDDK